MHPCKFLFVSAALVAGSAIAETVDRASSADARGEVEIINTAGSVRVNGWDKAEVQVHGELGRDVERLDVERKDNRVLIKVVLPSKHVSDADSELTVNVPRDSSLVISTVSADQFISAVNGAKRLQSVSGDVHTNQSTGELQVKSVSGDIRSSDSVANAGAIRIGTVSGDIDFTVNGSELDLRTVSGEIRVKASDITRAAVASTSGDLNLRSSFKRDAQIEVSSVSGDIDFIVNGAANAEFTAQTFSGSIDNCFGQKSKRGRDYGPGEELRFKEGEGQATVRIKSMSGDINLCR